MIIDFHTHIFPDKIAKRAISELEGKADLKAFTDGTYNGLLDYMKECGVDVSVILPVMTKPSQFESVNKYAAEISKKNGIISFGGMHPDSENVDEEIEKIKELGLLGIKLHPDYQGTFVDDEKYVNIISKALKNDLIVILHAGLDLGFPDCIHCTPERVENLLNKLEENGVEVNGEETLKLIFAHTGGYSCWDEVEERMVGKNIYLDCSFTLGEISNEQFLRIVSEHGADRILFATDSPWTNPKEHIGYLKDLDLTEEELEMIFEKNARNLLGEDVVEETLS